MKKLNIGLYGLGVVGQGLYEVLQNSKTVDAEIASICVKQEKERTVGESLITRDQRKIIENDDINIVVELIDDAEDAYRIVKEALLVGKNVVSGNKKMLAAHLEELIGIQKETGRSLLYDASACGSIPIIRNLEEYYDNDLLLSITGILNGSSNYILTKIFRDGQDYQAALKEAQELGFAESNPAFDVNGNDSLFKLVIITLHAFGLLVNPDDIFRFGISNISGFDVRFAKEKGLKIKLVAKVTKTEDNRLALYVAPQFVQPDKYIYNVEDEYNGVVIKGAYYDKQFMFGKGAGAYPTGSAVLSDITALSHNYKYEYKKLKYFKKPTFSNDLVLKIYLRYQREEDLELFHFEEILEQYSGTENRFVVGNMKLSNLLAIKEVLDELPVFLGVI
ncbi:MAG: homoserine dehydrogenase [Bacteroidales bacterium]|nr:homoserine dehydrogenase [Bacteroidales bacterium]